RRWCLRAQVNLRFATLAPAIVRTCVALAEAAIAGERGLALSERVEPAIAAAIAASVVRTPAVRIRLSRNTGRSRRGDDRESREERQDDSHGNSLRLVALRENQIERLWFGRCRKRNEPPGCVAFDEVPNGPAASIAWLRPRRRWRQRR